jgi:hypothetical protein
LGGDRGGDKPTARSSSAKEGFHENLRAAIDLVAANPLAGPDIYKDLAPDLPWAVVTECLALECL